MTRPPVGISGFAVYLPPYRVDLRAWCDWTGSDWDKVRHVVGTGFRLLGPRQSVYTMAANAVMRLIDQHDVDPSRVRYLALGTESSTDNSAGAIIVKGMVDAALRGRGAPALSRNCEVPEFKHACLGGIYGLKNALRYLATDGDDSVAIVVCADKALYERGSSGESTQGAGAVALLLESNPRIATIDLREAGTASDYRGIDFRKPLVNRNGTGASPEFVDIPVYNGRYSTSCYIDEMRRALADMYGKRGLAGAQYLREVTAVFMHRPYRRMPETGWSMAYLAALAAGGDADRAELAAYADSVAVPLEPLLQELGGGCDLARFAVRERIADEAFPLAQRTVRAFRAAPAFEQVVRAKMTLGAEAMQELGNLYTGALPAWLAAGLTEAAEGGVALAGREVLLVGYGSGDAADAIPLHVVAGWEPAALATGFAAALEPAIDLDHEQYLDLRERGKAEALGYAPRGEFVVERVGCDTAAGFQDAGVEYYRFIE